MSQAREFEITCPNSHNQTVSFTLEQLDNDLKSDALLFHCNTCDTNWTPSRADIDKMRRELTKAGQ